MRKRRLLSSGLWLTCLASLQIMLFSLSSQAQDLKKDLVAYWSFEGNFEDSVGIFDGTAMGATPIAFVNGKPGFGKAGQFNGDDQYVEITGGEPDDLAFEGGSFSIAGWFKVETFDTSWQALVAKGEGGNWRVHRRDAGQGLAFTGGPSGDTPTGKDVSDGEWHHFVAITDKDAVAFGTALYIDGALDTQLDAPQVLSANGLRMRIADNPGAPSREWEGLIDDLAIWSRVLSETEIKTLYSNGAGRSISSFFGTTIEILGVGTDALIGGDLTDPENDGLDALGAASSPTWNWVGITASHEPDFEGGENAFNIFDNKVGGGNDKWCCDDPTPGNPVWVAVQFAKPVSITHFTVTSGNDTPGRDPTDWAIQGSDDGAAWTDIYKFQNTTVPWTERNQVVKFTLAAGSTPYRNIRYIAYDTPATLHQINEIEYFGNFGGATVGFISGVRNAINTFSFRLNDDGASVVDPASVKLTLDGANIPLGTLTKTDGKIDVVHTVATPFLPGSVHTYAIAAKDGNGNNITAEGSFTTAAYALLTDSDKVAADTSKPGFQFRVHQNAAFQANDNTRPVQQLAGALGVNHADANVQGPALAPGVAGANDRMPLFFEIPTVINMNQDIGGSAGNAPEDNEIPGVPGIEGSTDGIAGEIITYIELPAGPTTMIFNSDDGFRTTAGQISDVVLAQFAGQFVGGRGAADTAFTVFAQTAGVYCFRTLWYEGGGGANLEWLSVKADGTKVLINDTENGGLKAYRAQGAGGTPSPAVTAASPGPGETGVAPDTGIELTIKDAIGTAVDANSVKVTINGAAATVTATKNGDTTTVKVASLGVLPPNSDHAIALTFRAGERDFSRNWTFRIGNYTSLTRAIGTRPGSGSNPGFRIRTVQSEAARDNTDALGERQLLDNMGNENIADLTGATGGFFNHTGVINFNQDAPAPVGNFTADNGNEDQPIPGIPGSTGSTDNLSQEILTFLELPAGVIRMGFNSDDGFNVKPVTAANAAVPPLGIFNGGRGAADTIFFFVVPAAGVYPMRAIWYEGGGGANAEWFTVDATGKKILINSSEAGAIKAFRTRDESQTLPGDAPTISIARTGANVVITFTGKLQSAASVLGPWTDVAGATSPHSHSVAANETQRFFRAGQ